MDLIIRKLKFEDCQSVATLHLEYLYTNIPVNKYSHNLLSYFYESFVISKGNISFVAEVERDIVGYVCLVTSLSDLKMSTLKTSFINIFRNIFLLFLISPKLILHELFSIGRSFISRQPFSNYIDSQGKLWELRPIVVRSDYQGKGIAASLVARAEKALREREAHRYFLKVYRNNRRAINFYKKAGFVEKEREGGDILVLEKTLG